MTTRAVTPIARAGSLVLYREASGLEKAMADTDADRLMRIYAELIIDQWDPYAISANNLPYLAWAVGVNLWEDDWDETFRRWWVAEQWTLKSQRGTPLGVRRFISAVRGEVKRYIRPPAACYPRRSDTDAERAAYVARFPQLRLYPYVARETLPWLCYTSNFPARGAHGSVRFVNNPRSGHSVTFGTRTIVFGTDVTIGADLAETMSNLMTWLTANPDALVDFIFIADTNTVAVTTKTAGFAGNLYALASTCIGAVCSSNTLSGGKDANGSGTFGKNGSFLGPTRSFPPPPWTTSKIGYATMPTVQNQGGNYTRTSKLYEPRTGVETTLTMRKVVRVRTGETAGWGFTPGVSAYDEEVVLPLTDDICFINHKYLGPNAGAKYGAFPNAAPKLRTITIARSGPLELTQGKAQYQTVKPQAQLLKLQPEIVATRHKIRPTELYASRGCYLNNKFLPPSNSWQHLYERWYIFDPDRVPDVRRTGTYLNHTRLRIAKYTSEVKVKVHTKMPRFRTYAGGYVYGFLSGPNTEPIDKIRRAVVASKALRDTVLIDTRTVRPLQIGDIIDASGRYTVGQLVPA